MPSLKALPSRVLLRFESAKTQTAGGLYIPETSQLRPEMGEIHDVGDGLTEEEKEIAKRLRELQAEGRKIPVTYMSGVGYWREGYERTLNEAEWGWLKDVRAYRLTELAAFLLEE
jgi:co-chaperonin GroES (HSP10)